MSLVAIPDTRTDITSESEQIHTIHTGGQRLTVDVIDADSAQLSPAAPISASFKIFPPSNMTIVDRFVKIKYYVQVVSDNGVPFVLGLWDCPRQAPATSLCRILNVKINGENISRNVSDLLHAELCYANNAESRSGSMSTSAMYPDQYQRLGDFYTDGFARNPAGKYGENSVEQTRGSLRPVESFDGGARLQYEVVEWLPISPFLDGSREGTGMINVNELYIDLNFDSLNERFMTCATRQGVPAPAQIDGVSVSFYRNPQIIMTYITPSNYQKLPSVQVFPYVKPREYPKTMAVLGINGTRTERTDAIRLSQIPRGVMLYAKRTKQTSLVNKPDSFLAITGIRVNFNNETGLLAGATQQNLFDMSVKNGCNLNWVQWSEKRGSVLFLDMGRDICLSSGLSAGTAGSFTLQVDVDFKNTSGENWEGDFYMILYDVGSIAISQNSCRSSLGNLSPSMVMSAELGGDRALESEHRSVVKVGSGLLSSLGTMLPSKHLRKHSAGGGGGGAEMKQEEDAPRKIGGSLLKRR